MEGTKYMLPTTLPQRELGRRVKAARELVGLSQEQLMGRMAARGNNRHDIRFFEDWRFGRNLEKPACGFTARHAAEIATVTGVPDSWFTEPLHLLLRQANQRHAEIVERLDRLERRVTAQAAVSHRPVPQPDLNRPRADPPPNGGRSTQLEIPQVEAPPRAFG